MLGMVRDVLNNIRNIAGNNLQDDDLQNVGSYDK